MVAEALAVVFPCQERFDAVDRFNRDLNGNVLGQEPSCCIRYVLGEGDDFRFPIELRRDVDFERHQLSIDIFAFTDDSVQVRKEILHFIFEIVKVGRLFCLRSALQREDDFAFIAGDPFTDRSPFRGDAFEQIRRRRPGCPALIVHICR